MDKVYSTYDIVDILDERFVKIGVRDKSGKVVGSFTIKKAEYGSGEESALSASGMNLRAYHMSIFLRMYINQSLCGESIEEKSTLDISPNHTHWDFETLTIDQDDFEELKLAFVEAGLNPTVEYIVEPDLVIPDWYAMPGGESYDDVSDKIYEQYGDFTDSDYYVP